MSMMPTPAQPTRGLYLITILDVHESARMAGSGQIKLRRDLYEVIDAALARGGLTRNEFLVTDTGDGLRLLIPLHKIEPANLVDVLVLGTMAGLRQHRRYANEDGRLRVRIAFDLGLIEPHLDGWAGDALVRIARLVDAEPVRAVLRTHSQLDVVSVASDVLFNEVIRPDRGFIPIDCFQRVDLKIKEFDGPAWILPLHPRWPCGSCGVRAA